MIAFQEARKKILEHCPQMRSEIRPIQKSLDYALAEAAIAREPGPLFDNSAMDGFAVLADDVEKASPENPVTLILQGSIQAGDAGKIPLQQGKAIKIFTGAALPPNAQAVVRKEYVEESGEQIQVRRPVRLGENIRHRGEEYQKGQQIFPAGTLITPAVLGMLANLGYADVSVFCKPEVAVLITGNELVPPGEKLQPGQIRDSNSYTISAALEAMNIQPVDIMRVWDDHTELAESFSRALKTADVVISVGGISMGDYDLVKSTVEKLGVSTVFWKVAMKPGKPNYFGILDHKLVFGLPGNPVSAAVSFYTLVRPALQKMCGYQAEREELLPARLVSPVKKKPGRMEFLRGIYYRHASGQLVVEPEKSQGSHMLTGLARANCLIYLPRENSEFREGQLIDIQPLQWGTL